MGLIEDMKRFLESQIDDFLIKNPHLELQVIGEQLAQQETDTMQLIVDLKAQEKLTEQEILDTAKEIKAWYTIVQKTTDGGRMDLAAGAQDRVNALLPQGNQLWGKMKGLQERITQAQDLLATIKTRHAEVKVKAAAAQATRDRTATQSNTSSWGSATNYTSTRDFADPLEAQFRQWEVDRELEDLKRNLGK
jgi:uncharacterized protein (TIGR04376 family)